MANISKKKSLPFDFPLSLIENAPYAFAYHKIILDEKENPIDYEYLYVNNKFKELTLTTNKEICGKTVTELFPDIIGSGFDYIKTFGEVALNQGNMDFEQYTDFLDKSYKISAYSNEKYYFTVIFSDVTNEMSKINSLNTAVKRIQKSEKRLKEAERIAKIGHFEMDIMKNKIYLSDEAYRILGINKDTFNPKLESFTDTIHPEDKEIFNNTYLSSISNNLDYSFEHKIVTPENNIKYVIQRGEIVYNKKNIPEKIMGTLQDISQKVENELSLQEALRMWQEIFQAIPHPTILLDEDQKILKVNRATLKFTDLAPDNLIGKSCHEIFHGMKTIPEGCPFSSSVNTCENKMCIIGTENYDKYVMSSCTPIFRHDKELDFVIHILTDITPQMKAQEELKKTNEKLKEAIDLANLLTKYANAANAAKSEFLANISHEIRTPLNGIMGFAELLDFTDLKPMQRDYLENIKNSSSTLMNLINDLINFARIESGEIQMNYLSTDIFKLCEEVIDNFTYDAFKKKINLYVNIAPATPSDIVTDQQKLKQILTNLLGNAVKFTDYGYVELKVDFNKLENKECLVTFRISDTGIGIKDEYKDKLFRPFSQGDSSITKKYGGAGLGLAIVEKLARSMDSEIRLETTYQKGSEFYFSLKANYNPDSMLNKDNIRCYRKVFLMTEDNYREIFSNLFKYLDIEIVPVKLKNLTNDVTENNLFIFDFNSAKKYGTTQTNSMIQNIIQKEGVVFALVDFEDKLLFEYQFNCKGVDILEKPVKLSKIYNTLRIFKDKNKKDNKPLEIMPSMRNLGIKILIAEDVELNMFFISSLLKKIIPNATIIESRNGMEALKYFKNKQSRYSIHGHSYACYGRKKCYHGNKKI